ncbi:hypothetical protein PMAYCL1PPCAC_12820 [Pristionchus mayeri]|uniref:Glutaredoxin domain-containing protein n=1 Tax=Pristionchus mayeri TaxID=1317129 RepID=A0AAN4ZRU7_9BILA|nr:hypothetical protein PMAYCL1PPCAC_12820 [Pristionchus mayeri]
MMVSAPSPSSGLSVEIRLADQRRSGLDVKTMKKELHRMKMELIGALDSCGIERTKEQDLLQRDGSVRGRSLHVMSTVRHLANRSQWKRDYVAEESGKVVLYITSCQVINANYERCKDALSLLRAFGISHEVRDVYVEPKLVEELIDRMQLEPDLNRDLIFESLPMVFVNGRYFGNDATLIQENESRSLSGTLRDFHGRSDCSSCGGVGYTICVKCRGGKKSNERYSVLLKCASCNSDGITPCLGCAPKTRRD